MTQFYVPIWASFTALNQELAKEYVEGIAAHLNEEYHDTAFEVHDDDLNRGNMDAVLEKTVQELEDQAILRQEQERLLHLKQD